jgi:hypothetical protein
MEQGLKGRHHKINISFQQALNCDQAGESECKRKERGSVIEMKRVKATVSQKAHQSLLKQLAWNTLSKRIKGRN